MKQMERIDKEGIVFKVDPKGMWVKLAIRPSLVDGFYTADFIIDFLKENGITAGINRQAVEALVGSVQYEKGVIVATGKPAVAGTDGFYKYLLPLEDEKGKPVVGTDGSVDYVNSLKIAMVEEGQMFAVYEPPTKGEYGYTVFSEKIKPVPGRNEPMLRGKGFDVSEDGRQYRANTSGRIYMDNDKVYVDPLYVVNGDLEIEHGNITFNGDVKVTGDVRSGMSIVAGGSIFVDGHVGNCQLKADKNITIGKGIQGKYGCEITAGGDVVASFVERANITAGANVYANSLLDCNVSARGSVIVMSKHGCVIGGNIKAMQSVTVKDLGNVAGVATKVQFGESETYRMELNNCKQRLKKVTEDIKTLEKQLERYDKTGAGQRNRQMEMTKIKVIRAKVLRQAEQRQLEEKEMLIEKELSSARGAYVRVNGIIYPGVVLMTGTAVYAQVEAYKDVYYRYWIDKIQPMSPEDFESGIIIEGRPNN